MTNETEYSNCPKCGVSLIGEPIPEKDREFFGNAINFMRTIGIYSMEEDRTIIWKCPDCGYEWDRE